MRNTQRMNSFLVEMVVVILFFALSATVTLQLFVAAHNKSAQSREINVAVIKAQEMLESARLPGAGDAGMEEKYDKNWNAAQHAPKYIVKMKITSARQPAGTMRYSHVDVIKMTDGSESTIYQLDGQNYSPD